MICYLFFLELVSLYIEPGGTVRFLRVVIIWGHTTIVALVLSIDKMALIRFSLAIKHISR